MKTIKELKLQKTVNVLREMQAGKEDNNTLLEQVKKDMESEGMTIVEVKHADNMNEMTMIEYYKKDTVNEIEWNNIPESMTNDELIISFKKRNPIIEVLDIKREYASTNSWNEKTYKVTVQAKNQYYSHGVMKNKDVKSSKGFIAFKSNGYIYTDTENDRQLHGDAIKKDMLIMEEGNIIGLNIMFGDNKLGEYKFI